MVDLLDPTTEEDEVISSVPGSLDPQAWREEHNKWLSNYQAWKTLVRTASGGYEGAESTFEPRELWSDSLIDWSDTFASYNDTYYEVCTPQY